MPNNPNAFPEPGDESLFAIPEAGAGRLSPLEILGGYDEVREGVSYLSDLIRDDGADMCALVVKGIDIQPYGLPSVLLGPREAASAVYDEGVDMVTAAWIQGANKSVTADLCYGREAAEQGRAFLKKLLEVVAPELAPDQSVELQQLVADISK